MEKIITCAIIAFYAVYVDLQAAVLRSRAASVYDFQVLPMIIWAATMSGVAVVYVLLVFGAGFRNGKNKNR